MFKSIRQNDRIKALWLCSWYPNRTTPYLGSFIRSQAKATAHFSDIIVLNVCGDTVEDYDIVVEQSDFLTIQVYYPNSNNIFIKAYRQTRAQQKGYEQIKQMVGKPDIVHLNVIYPSGLFCFILSILEKLPFVISEHSSIYRPERQLYKGFFLRIIPFFAIKWAKSVILLTKYNVEIMQQYWKLHNNNYLTIPNVVDTQIFNLKNENMPVAQNIVCTFLHVSWLDDSVKNISGIIRSVALLAQIRSDFRVQIMGDTNKHSSFITLANQLNILDKFVFLYPELTNDMVAIEMQKSDVFLMFSNVEGLPCAILEAMSVGLPIIATETGGMSDWVTPETGILINIGDEAGLVEAMNSMIDNYLKYDPLVIRSRIIEKCSVETIGKSITAVYKDVLNKKYSQ